MCDDCKCIPPKGPTKLEVQTEEAQKNFNLQLDVMNYVQEVAKDILDNNSPAIKNSVYLKFGYDGVKILESIWNGNASEEPDDAPTGSDEEMIEVGENDDCPECGQMSDELMVKFTNQIQIIDDFTSEDTEAIAQKVIDSNHLVYMFSENNIKKIMFEFKPEVPIDQIPPEAVLAIKRKIIFIGVLEGWLLNTLFCGDIEL